MSLLFESIACRDGHLSNLQYHQERVNRSRSELLNLNDPLSLKKIAIPETASKGLWKCRVSYGHKIEQVEFIRYESKNPQTYRLVVADISYPYKFVNRAALNELSLKRENADDILIAVNGLITDTSYGNFLVYDGMSWLTPTNPLLRGTMRARLLDTGDIQERIITRANLAKFQKFMMINALNPFEEARALPMDNIIL